MSRSFDFTSQPERVCSRKHRLGLRSECPDPDKRDRLQAGAKGWAAAFGMAVRDFFSHTGAGGSSASQRVSAEGYSWSLVGENIAAGYDTAAETFATWAASPGHRANMLNCAFRQTGIAVVYQADDQPLPARGWAMHHYWVQTFGSRF